MLRRYQQVDVFGSDPFSGNPLAVVLQGEGLSPAEMQRFARWMNLSESAFILPPTTPEADYRVRIFTLARELPFAGHPTLGSCHAWLTDGGEPRRRDVIVQESQAGLVKVRRYPERLSFASPPLVRSGPVEEPLVEELASVLQISRGDIVAAQWVDNGPGWVALLLQDAASVLALDPDGSRWSGEGSLEVGVAGAYPPDSECAFEVRAFFTDEGGEMREDPVTGSLNAGLGEWLFSSGVVTAPYVASQGTRLGRRGRVYVERDRSGTVWVGGSTVTKIEGHAAL